MKWSYGKKDLPGSYGKDIHPSVRMQSLQKQDARRPVESKAEEDKVQKMRVKGIKAEEETYEDGGLTNVLAK
jgi:hypothetical protein